MKIIMLEFREDKSLATLQRPQDFQQWLQLWDQTLIIKINLLEMQQAEPLQL